MSAVDRKHTRPEMTAPPEGVATDLPVADNLHRCGATGNGRNAHAFDGHNPTPLDDGGECGATDTLPAASAVDDNGWPAPPDPAAYYGLAGDFVRAIEPNTEADPVALLAHVLVGFGSLVGCSSYFPVEAAKHPARLNAVLVGQSSKARKGTAERHVRRLLSQVDEAWATDRIEEGMSSGEGLIWAVRNPIAKEEPIREGGKKTGRVIDYETVVSDPGVDDKRLLVMEGEFASVLRVMSREGNSLSPVIRRAWDSGDLGVLTKNNQARATGAHISIIGHITRDELLRYLDSTEQGNGFANRFLWLAVRRSKLLPEGGGLVADEGLVDRLRAVVAWCRDVPAEGRSLAWDDAALEMWYEIYGDLSEGKPGLLGAVTARAEANVVRLALTYALLDCSPHIRTEHLEAALALWEYAEASAAWIFGTATGDPLADRIVEALSGVPDRRMTRNELGDVFGRHIKADRVTRALTQLQAAGRVGVYKIETNGRPAQAVQLLEPSRDGRGTPRQRRDTALIAQQTECTDMEDTAHTALIAQGDM